MSAENDRLREDARRDKKRKRGEAEFELSDAGVFAENRYFDVVAEYAKGGPNDILIRVTATNRGPERAPLALLPTLWFRNTWVWGRSEEAAPRMSHSDA